MRRQKVFRIASGVALVAWVGTALAAVLVGAFGVIGLTGSGDYRRQGEQQMDGDVILQGDVRPVDAALSGRLFLDAEPGWDSLMASLYGMQVLTLLVLAFLFAQLWLLLRAASRGEAFSGPMVRRLRIMGGTIVGWEFLEPFLWLFFSPKANGYGETHIGPGANLTLSAMEPGGPSWTVISFGLLLLLLAELFRHGADLAEEQRLTV